MTRSPPVAFAQALATLGMQALVFSWIAIAVTFRALYHYEWIPSTIAFTGYLFFSILCYQNLANNLVPYPSQMGTTLLGITRFASREGVFDTLGAYNLQLDLGGLQDCVPEPNSTVPVLSFLGNPVADIPCHGHSTLVIPATGTFDLGTGGLPPGTGAVDVECGGARNLLRTFVTLQWIHSSLVAILFLVLCRADRMRKLRLPNGRRLRHLILAGVNDGRIVGVRLPLFLCLGAFFGFGVSCAALERATTTYERLGFKYDLVQTTVAYTANIDLSVDYQVWTFFPFLSPQLDIATVLVVVATVAVIRGCTRQSVSAFRLACIASALHVLLAFPTVVGELKQMHADNIWPWGQPEECQTLFAGVKAFLYPSPDDAKALCTVARTAISGVFFTFVCMFLNVGACLRCFMHNRDRASMTGYPFPQEEDGMVGAINTGDAGYRA